MCAHDFDVIYYKTNMGDTNPHVDFELTARSEGMITSAILGRVIKNRR